MIEDLKDRRDRLRTRITALQSEHGGRLILAINIHFSLLAQTETHQLFKTRSIYNFHFDLDNARPDLRVTNTRLLHQNIELMTKHFELEAEVKEKDDQVKALREKCSKLREKLAKTEQEKEDHFRTRNYLADLVNDLRKDLEDEVDRNKDLEAQVRKVRSRVKVNTLGSKEMQKYFRQLSDFIPRRNDQSSGTKEPTFYKEYMGSVPWKPEAWVFSSEAK
ncbi:predicted protein [Nematostella vectensis]|uniref:Uncharacterized protein n=1 Tax=Nematostella vectensis TaxID=45351 RepID=A7SXT3_NEMVE|nr:predicted protein [Nematostella vectensis]|eukprot:XP_001623592.1 predicted protein [Nematostella vectensis]